MILLNWSRKLGKNFAIDICAGHFYQSFKEGIEFYQFKIDASWFRGDHNPQFNIFIVFLNFVLLDLNVYNVHHVKDDDEDDPA